MGRILMVDDEKDMPILIKQRFREHIRQGNLEFFFAQDGFEALALLEEKTPIDVLVTDIHMPGMDGLTLLEKVSTYSPKTRGIVLSAYDDLKNLRKAMGCGAFDFIAKPIHMGELEASILKALRKSRTKNFCYFAPAVLGLSQDDRSIVDFLKNTGFKHQMHPPFYGQQDKPQALENLPFQIKLLFDPQKTPVVLDLITLKEGFVFLILVMTSPLVPFTSILKVREVLKALSLITTEASIFFQHFKTYQRIFSFQGIGVARCFIPQNGQEVDVHFLDSEGDFVLGKDFESKISGPQPLSSQETQLSFVSSPQQGVLPLLALRASF